MYEDKESKKSKAIQSIEELYKLGVISKQEFDKLRLRISDKSGETQNHSNNTVSAFQQPENSQSNQPPVIVRNGNGCITFLLFIIALPTMIGILIYVIIFGAVGCTLIR